MLKELVDIGEYASGLYSEIEAYIEKPSGTYNIFSLIFDGENFDFEFKEGENKDLVGMCFKPAKGRVKAILPVVNNLSIDKKNNKINIKVLYETLDELKNDFAFVGDIKEKIENYDFSTIIEQLQGLKKKDENKKIITNILTLKLTKDYVNRLGLTISENKETYYFGEIQEFKNYFLQKVKGEGAKFESGFCYVCEKHKDDLINFQKSKGVNFPYKFYNLDKPGFAYELDNDKNGYKSFGICQTCYNKIKIGFSYFKNNLYKNILGKKAYLFPSIYFSDKEKIKEVYGLFDKYSNDNISKLEENVNQEQGEKEIGFSNDFFENIFGFSTDEEKKQITNSFIKFNFLFGYIDSANSDTFKINYFIKEVLPSNIISYYKSLPETKNDEYYFLLLKKLFGDKINKEFKSSLLNSNLRLFPSYKKGEKIWSVYEFFKQFSENDYYYFLDKILHNEKVDDKFVFKLVRNKLKEQLKNDKKENKRNLVFSLYEAFQIIEWLKKPLNNKTYLLYKQNKMDKIQFNTTNENIKRLETYFNERLDIFDSYDRIYASLAGLYTMLFIKKQQKEISSNPFLTEIDFDKMDYEKIWKIVEKARNKFNRYSSKKFEYHPNLYKLLLEQRMNIEKNLNPDELVYYFSIGMEILPGIYLENKEESIKETEN